MRTVVDKPSPVTGGRLELRKEMTEVTFRGEQIPYEKSFYHCVDSGLEFVDEELENANLKQVYDTYRRRHSIPLAEELRQMRERYGVPTTAMSIILGLGENQYGLYEEGTVPTPSVGRLLAFAMDPANMMAMLQAARGSFSDKQYGKYFASIAASMPPAKYGTEGDGWMDFCLYSSFPATRIVEEQRALSSRRSSYNDYCYAPAC